MNRLDAAKIISGVGDFETKQASAPTNVHIITGEVGATSEDGKVTVAIDGLVFSDDEEQFVEFDTLGGLEEGDTATILLTGESGHAMVPLAIGGVGTVDRIVERVGQLYVDYAEIGELVAEKATISDLNAATARIDDLEADTADISDLVATKATISDLNAATARIDDLEADTADISDLVATKAAISDLNAATARIGDLEADHVSVSDFQAEQANIDSLQAATADISTIRANSAKVANLTAQELEADHATIAALDSNYVTTDFLNADVGWIENGVIKDGSISSAMINSLSANKLSAGTINGSVITVTNLNADNITTGTINGQRIGEGSLSLDKLSEDVYTEAEVNSIVDGLNDRIDGAIETFTGTAVPTLNNQPASSWNTTKLRDEHVGDVYYVVNSQSQQNGYCYRFTKSGSSYSWQLIKDSDVTAALSRLSTAEGKITTFDSDISKLKTDTGTLTTRTTNLETRADDVDATLLDKVDVTTFNEVSDTVDSHTQTISQHTTAISNKADSSTVTAVTNRVSKNEQDISGINTTIGELQDTVETKADGSTVSTISNKLNTVSDTVDGHTQTISSVQNTLNTKADSSTVSTLTTKVNTVSDTVDGHTQRLSSVEDTLETKADSSTVSTLTTKVNTVSDTVDGHTSQLTSITSTQTTMQSTLDKTVKSSIQLWYSKANTTAPNKPTAQVTSTSTAGNAWRIVVPAYNASYPNYYYCWQYEYTDGTYGWSAVVRDIAMGESQATARTADSNASAAVTTANTASTTASEAKTTANTANTNASEAKTTASEAKTTAETAASDASTAKTNAASAVSTANSASTTATNAQSTANANIKSSVQLWFTKANSTAPNKPTSVVSTSNANTANAWNLVVPVWNSSYPHYFYCYQQQKGDGTYQWTDVVYDRATSEAQQLANTTSTNLSTLQEDYATYKQTTTESVSSIGTRLTTAEGKISTAETAIDQNRDAIALRATKTEVLDTGNMLKDTSASIIAKVYGPANRYWSDSAQTHITPSLVALSDPPEPDITHAAQFVSDGSRTSSSARAIAFYSGESATNIPMKEGQTYTASWWARKTSGSGRTRLSYRSGGAFVTATRAGATGYDDELTTEWKQCTRTFTMGEVTDYNRVWFYADFSASTSGTVQLCGFRLVPATYATNAELKVTADGISSTVERIGGFKYLESPSVGASLSNIKTYAADGRVDNWSVKSTNDVRVGDFIYLKYKDTTRKCDIYVKGKVLAINSRTNINLESHGYEDVLPVETIKSTINQSADSVKIQAKHVEIDGTAIFNNTDFKQAADAAYDAKGAASTAEANAKSYADDIEVGGRNLLKLSGTLSSTCWVCVADTVTDGVVSLTMPSSGNVRFYQMPENGYWSWEPSTAYVASVEARIVSGDGKLGINPVGASVSTERIDITTEWKRYEYAFVSSTTVGTGSMSFYNVGATGSVIECRYPKLERGNRATDWTPAPEDVAADISASVVGQGGFTILWNYSNFTTANNGEAYVCALDPLTNQTSDEDGWAMWNGVKRVIPHGMINPNSVIPFRIPIYVVCRLSSADATTGTLYLVWYDDRWKWSACAPSAVGGTFTWTEATDMVLGTFVMTSAKGPISETVVFRTPWSSKQVTTSTVTANSAQNLANTANNTANAAAPKANAVARSQRIYYRSSSSTKPTAMPSAWVTETGNKYATNATTAANWSTKVTPIANGTGASVTKYLYLWTCEQREMGDGDLEYTNVLLDDSTTVIDGGTIVTNSLSANAINATSGTFAQANIPALTADHIKANVISAVNNGTGTINADKINVSGITIGYDQVEDTPTIPSTVAELSDASDYAKQSALTAEINQRKAAYATSSTAAGSQGKVANCANFALYTGASVTVTFSNANTHATPTLNVNSTGSKSIRGYTGAALTAAEYKWAAGAAITFVYDGTYWRMQDGGAQQAKADAASSASAASTSATNAATSASNASTSATNAANSASTASTKAGEASTSATNAASSASTASSKATAASNSASAASTSATNAANSATSASNSASSASTSATNAATSATKALDAAAGWYAECTTDGATTAKVATITPATTNFTLTKGVVVHVKFSNLNSGAVGSLTLNVNSTGAKSIKYISSGGTIANLAAANWLRANVTYEFYYDGTYWIAQQSYNTNNYDRENYKAELAASTAISAGQIAVLGTDGKLKLLNASAFDYSGPILYVATAYSADDVSDGTKRTTNYTFWGTTFTLTNTHSIANAAAGSAVYIVGTVSGKTFTPNSTVLTCKVPTTKDNLVYIRLGLMSSTTAAVLESDHPMYMFFNGAFQQCDAATANAACTATNYITHVDNNGITIHPQSGTSNRVAINADGMEVFKGDESVASYGDTARIGKQAGPRVVVETSKLSMYAGSTGETLAAEIKTFVDDYEGVHGEISTDFIKATMFYTGGGDATYLSNGGLYIHQGGLATIPSMAFGTLGYQHLIDGINFGFSSATTNSNGVTTFNPDLGVKPTAVFVAPGKASNETEAVAKIAVPMVWSIDSATQVQVRWQRSDTNAWLASNAVGWYWLALYSRT